MSKTEKSKLFIESKKILLSLEKRNDQDAQRSMNNLVEQLAMGNKNPGIGTEHLFNDVFELRGKNRARVYYREVGGKIEILGKSVKNNQQKVIDILKNMYG